MTSEPARHHGAAGPSDFAVDDLRELVRVGLARGAALLTAGELVRAGHLLRLEGDAARVYARLSARVPQAFHAGSVTVPGVVDVDAAAGELIDLGLADRLVPAATRHQSLPLRVIRKGTGWFRLAGRDLVARLARFAHQQPFPDRSAAVVERLGLVRWPPYDLTGGPGLHRDRARLLAWEALLRPRDLDHVLSGLATGAAEAPGGLDLRRALRRVVREAAERAERSKDADTAANLYRRLVDAGERPGRVAFRHARAEEARGRPAAALSVLRAALPDAWPSEVPAVVRCGRRLARGQRTSFVPAPARRTPVVRDVRLEAVEKGPSGLFNGLLFSGAPPSGLAGRGAECSVEPKVRSKRSDRPAGSRGRGAQGGERAVERFDSLLQADEPNHRPRWATPAGPRTVEAAVVAWLASHGRMALHVEGALSSTVCALLLAELYFLPVPGALPVRQLAGPLDLGTPAFRRSRAEAWEALALAVAEGQAPARVAAADARWRGIRLAGARWDRAPSDALVRAAGGYGPAALTLLLERFADHGPRAMGGFPDLVVFPGEPVRLGGAFPSRLPGGLVLAEVKGPGDTVRDAQLVWAHHLATAGAQVELWKVGPTKLDAVSR